MYFDMLCAVIEKVPDLFPSDTMDVLHTAALEAKLFLFNKTIQQLTTDIDYDHHYHADNFVLPFDITCVEDPDGCVILMGEPEDKSLRDILGIVCARCDEAADLSPDRKPGIVVGVMWAEMSLVSTPERTPPYSLRGPCVLDSVAILSSRHEVLMPDAVRFGDELLNNNITRDMYSNIASAVEEVMFINSPKRFVLEIAGLNPRPVKTKIPRSDQRPRYTVVRPQEARAMMKLPSQSEGEHGTKAPHERRRHLRTLRSEHFVHKQGQTIVIPSCWIGPKENVVGNKRYRVMTEL